MINCENNWQMHQYWKQMLAAALKNRDIGTWKYFCLCQFPVWEKDKNKKYKLNFSITKTVESSKRKCIQNKFLDVGMLKLTLQEKKTE